MAQVSSPASIDSHGDSVNSNPSLRMELLGAAKPGSRPHHWQSTTVPGVATGGATLVASVTCGPANRLQMNSFQSIDNTPEQF